MVCIYLFFIFVAISVQFGGFKSPLKVYFTNKNNGNYRLKKLLIELGISEEMPSHVTYNLLTNILSITALTGDRDLESACELRMKVIKQIEARKNKDDYPEIL